MNDHQQLIKALLVERYSPTPRRRTAAPPATDTPEPPAPDPGTPTRARARPR